VIEYAKNISIAILRIIATYIVIGVGSGNHIDLVPNYEKGQHPI
jgi:hypothetical protein